MIDPFRTAELQSHPWLRQVIYSPQMSSTNDVALKLAADELLATPVLVVTSEQTAGRGRGANRWWSAPGSLTFSLVVDLAAHLPLHTRGQLALVAGLGIRDALATWLERDVRVKWPNDVYCDGKKICGILIEASAARPRRAVVGVGINVNNSLADAPLDVRRRASSLCDLRGQAFDIAAVLRSVIDHFRQRLAAWETATETLAEQWTPHCLLTGRIVTLEMSGRPLVGRCEGISGSGELQLRTAEGLVSCVSAVVTSFEH